MFIHCNYKS